MGSVGVIGEGWGFFLGYEGNGNSWEGSGGHDVRCILGKQVRRVETRYLLGRGRGRQDREGREEIARGPGVGKREIPRTKNKNKEEINPGNEEQIRLRRRLHPEKKIRSNSQRTAQSIIHSQNAVKSAARTELLSGAADSGCGLGAPSSPRLPAPAPPQSNALSFTALLPAPC